MNKLSEKFKVMEIEQKTKVQGLAFLKSQLENKR